MRSALLGTPRTASCIHGSGCRRCAGARLLLAGDNTCEHIPFVSFSPRVTPTTVSPSSSCLPPTVLLRRVSPRYRRRSCTHILVHIVPVHIHIMSCADCTSAPCVLGMLHLAHLRALRVSRVMAVGAPSGYPHGR